MRIEKLPKTIRLSCERDDGGGAQIHARVSVLAFCRFFGLGYQETPMTTVLFAPSQGDVDAWNSFINFQSFSDSPREVQVFEKIKSTRRLVFRLLTGNFLNNHFVLNVESCHGFTDRFPGSVDTLREELRKACPIVNIEPEGSSRISCVIHVRGEIGGVDELSPRRSSDEVLRIKAEVARSRHNDKFQKIKVFTSEVDNKLLGIFGDEFEIDYSTKVQGVLHTMVKSSTLVMAKSSLSYVAALLSTGYVVYEPMWHPKMPDWNTLSPGPRPYKAR